MTDQELIETSTQTAGALLTQARKERNLTVVDVAGKLRIAPRQIEALEADEYARLPGHTIARGFVRNYARLLQLNPESVLEAFEKHVPKEADTRISLPDQKVQFSESGNSRHNRVTLWATLGILVLTALGVAIWKFDGNLKLGATEPAPGLVPVPRAADTPAVPTDVASSADVTAPPVVVPSTVTNAGIPAAPAAQTTAAVTPEILSTPTPVSLSDHVVHLAFAGSAWVEVRDQSGKLVWSKNNAAGSEQDITAAPPLSFTIGNAAKVKMTYNGDAFDLTPHIQGVVAKFKLEK